jgi:hypothetical protein
MKKIASSRGRITISKSKTRRFTIFEQGVKKLSRPLPKDIYLS